MTCFNITFFIEKGKLFQVGVGLNYELLRMLPTWKWKSPYPTRVASINAIGAKFTDAKNDFKLSTELMAAKSHVGLEAQYIYMNVNRRDNQPSYKAHGVLMATSVSLTTTSMNSLW